LIRQCRSDCPIHSRHHNSMLPFTRTIQSH
jgi:hypothetical protein